MTFGLSEDLIAKTMSDVIVESWYVGILALGWILSKWPYFLGYFLFLVTLIFGIFFFLKWAKENKVDWIFEELTKENQGRTFLTITQWQWIEIGRLFSEMSSWFIYPMLVLGLASFLVGYPYQKAKNFAEEQMNLYQQHGCQNENQKYHCASLIDSSNKKVLIQGILISANNNRVAIYNNKIEIWPLLDNYIIRQNKPVNMDEVGDKA
jgi:hypothetical protein